AGGIENLSRSFLDQLLRLDRVNQYTVLVPAEVRYDFDTRASDNVTVQAVDGPGAYARMAVVAAARALHQRLRVQYWRTRDVETLARARALGAEVALSMP